MGISASAVFFLKDGNVIKQMMMSEFDAVLDGVVEMPEFKSLQVQAVYLQIDSSLCIRGLVFFLIGFTSKGMVVPEWNLPIQQLIQSAGRGPDLGAGPIKLACKSQSTVPWHQQALWDPQPQMVQQLVQIVKRNRLGVLEEEEFFLGDSMDDIPTLSPAFAPPKLMPEPPMLTPSFQDIPVVSPAIVSVGVENNSTPVTPEKDVVDVKLYADLKQEFDAMRAAYSVRVDKYQKERDELKEKNKQLQEQVKNNLLESELAVKKEFDRDLDAKKQQIEALNVQIEHEQKRYGELKQQLVMQAEKYQQEREALAEQLKHEIDSDKIESLKDAFRKELDARVDAEISKVNEALAKREVELFYRDEQLNLFQSEIKQLRVDRQEILRESGKQILQALENNGVTLVAYNVGVGHITLPLDDVGQYLDDRLQYLAERCGVTSDVFALWQEHYYKPVCHHVDDKGDVCNKAIRRTDLASEFIRGQSDRCSDHAVMT